VLGALNIFFIDFFKGLSYCDERVLGVF